MAKFVLQPCEIRDFKICIRKDLENLELDWQGLLNQFQLAGQESKKNLQRVKVGVYVGLCRGRMTGKPVCFVWELRPDAIQTRDIEYMTKVYPDIQHKILTIFRVEVAQWDAQFTETGVQKGVPPKAPPQAARPSGM
jgi:hypothetical protein